MNVHSNINHNSPNFKITQISLNRRMDKQIVVYLYIAILLSKKERGDD